MNLFQQVNKKISPYMKSRGFFLSGRTYYFIAHDIAHCIAFDMPSGLMYVTVYVMPLYIPCECRYYTYGNRLSDVSNIKLPILSKGDEETKIDEWCDIFCQHIEERVMPYFREVGSPSKLIEYADRYSYSPNEYFACHEMHILRLKMFTYLYLHERHKVSNVTAHYRDVLKGLSFLTDYVRQIYTDEIDEVETILQGPKEAARVFCSNVISNTKKFFPEGKQHKTGNDSLS